jgi:hypothetical protein
VASISPSPIQALLDLDVAHCIRQHVGFVGVVEDISLLVLQPPGKATPNLGSAPIRLSGMLKLIFF